MTLPLYADHGAPRRRLANSHAGLWHQRFFDRFEPDRETTKWTVGETAKGEWLKTLEGPCGDAEALRRAVRHCLVMAEALGGECRAFVTDWHFATGLGLPHPVENGFTWHPTLGVPYLCGAAVKGLVRAWVECWEDLADDERERRLANWFGEPDGAGGLIFFDAIPLNPPRLAVDVMTPHMGKWYEQGGLIKNPEREPQRLPADWHDPVPVPFLAVRQAAFLFALAPRTPAHVDRLKPAFAALEAALSWLGAGAKTAAGYGRMAPSDVADKQLSVLIEAQRRAAEEARARRAREETLAAMDPFDRELRAIIDGSRDEPYLALLHALRAGRWKGEQVRRVAERIKALMQEKGAWREKSQKKNPAKDVPHQRTLEVMKWL